MSFVSLTEVCRQLGIDAKTLRRWLAQAQLGVQAHPDDGRKRGLNLQQLHQLAALHQRSLATLPPASPLATSSVLATLPDRLLSLPEQLHALQSQLSALQTQIAALQQQVRDLTLPPPAKPAGSRGVAASPSSAAATPPAASPARRRKAAHVLPLVEYVGEGQYVVISPHKGRLKVQPDTPSWFAWLAQVDAFRFVGQHGHFTAHYDPAGGTRTAWRAHRKIRNRTHTHRLSRSSQLSIAVLEQAAAALQAQLD